MKNCYNNMRFEHKATLVSIVILAYEDYSSLEITIKSILNQNYDNMEIILSDDCSKQYSYHQIKSIIKQIDIRTNNVIKIYRNEENMGVVAHANKVAQKCRGKYIKFLPLGDYFATSQSLTILVDKIQNSKCKIVTSPSIIYEKETGNALYQFPSNRRLNKLINKNPSKQFSVISKNNIISAVGTIFDREFFENGGFDEKYIHLDDWPTWLRYFRMGNIMEFVTTPTVYYQIGGISSNLGNAFKSKLLHNDMIMCYEREILPYKNQFSVATRWFINYYYSKLKSDKSINKIIFLPLVVFDLLKQIAKKTIVFYRKN